MSTAIEDILRDALDKAEARISDAEARLVPLYAEREKVLRALAAVQSEPVQSGLSSSNEASNLSDGGSQNPFSSLTMKELTVKALSERFKNGATAAQLMAFFAEAWGRKDIVRSSFSPQLSRLKGEGVVRLQGKIWTLVAHEPKKNEPPLGGSYVEEVQASLMKLEGATQRGVFD